MWYYKTIQNYSSAASISSMVFSISSILLTEKDRGGPEILVPPTET